MVASEQATLRGSPITRLNTGTSAPPTPKTPLTSPTPNTAPAPTPSAQRRTSPQTPTTPTHPQTQAGQRARRHAAEATPPSYPTRQKPPRGGEPPAPSPQPPAPLNPRQKQAEAGPQKRTQRHSRPRISLRFATPAAGRETQPQKTPPRGAPLSPRQVNIYAEKPHGERRKKHAAANTSQRPHKPHQKPHSKLHGGGTSSSPDARSKAAPPHPSQRAPQKTLKDAGRSSTKPRASTPSRSTPGRRPAPTPAGRRPHRPHKAWGEAEIQGDTPQNTSKASSLAPRCLTDLPSTCPREDSPRQGRGGAPQRPQCGGVQWCSFRDSPAGLGNVAGFRAWMRREDHRNAAKNLRQGIYQALETLWVVCVFLPVYCHKYVAMWLQA